MKASGKKAKAKKAAKKAKTKKAKKAGAATVAKPKFKKAAAKKATANMQSATDYCYTKSGSSSIVSLWQNGFKVGETTQADADARGIPPCG